MFIWQRYNVLLYMNIYRICMVVSSYGLMVTFFYYGYMHVRMLKEWNGYFGSSLLTVMVMFVAGIGGPTKSGV